MLRALGAGVAAISILGAGMAAVAAAPPPAAKEAGAALDARFPAILGTGGPGCVEGIASGGKLIAARAQGLANLELGVPMTTQMAFDIGSTSKQFTATAIAILARRGKIDLDADIHTYLPEMHRFDPPVTVRDLIYHSGGLADVYEPLEWQYGDHDGNRYPSDYTLVLARGMTKTKFKPGSRFEYSNIGYLLLGQIVERVSGESLRKFADDNIFGPMGMTHTHFHDDYRELVPNKASAYSLKPDGKTWEWRHSDFTVMGDGGVFSTLGDLAKWYDVYADPSKLEGGRALLDLLLTPGTYSEKGADYRGKPIRYGFGMQMFDWKGHPVIGHPGGWAGYGTVPYYFPERNFAVIAICNVQKLPVLDAVLDTGAELAGGR